MIIHSFDESSEAVFGPGAFYGEKRELCELCIVTFSDKIYAELQRRLPCREAAVIGAANGARPIWLTEVGGRPLAFFLSQIGATLCATDLIEVNWLTGATKYILFGSAGSLDSTATKGKYVLPTEAYRDEGMSYHYAPPADYIRIRNSGRMAELFSKLNLPFVQGRIWTTDAVYRETREQLRRRRAEGCLAVEMEIAGVQAVCDFYGWELYPFLATGDALDREEYDPTGLPSANHCPEKLDVALEIAARI